MESILKMQAGEYYIIESTASANSVYFENDNLAKLFFRYCDYYLKDYLHIEEYTLNASGWGMLIKVKSAQTIRKHYDKVLTSRISKQIKEGLNEPTEIWRILSERVRMFISTYVRMSNKLLGREGSLVRRKYGRYKFDSLSEAEDYISNIRHNQHDLNQPKEKYRGYKEQFQMSGNFLKNPLRSSLWLEINELRGRIQEEVVEKFGAELLVLHGLGNLVRQKSKLIKSTPKHPRTNPPYP